MKVKGNLAYVADGNMGLQIIDVSQPTAPREVGNVDTPGRASDVALTGNNALVADGFHGLQVIDVSDPGSPRIVGSVDTPGDANGVDFNVLSHQAVVADGTSIQVVSLTNPAAPMILGSRGMPSTAVDVVVSGFFAFVATSTAGMQVVNFSDPPSPQVIGGTQQTQNTVAQEVALLGSLAFLADVIFVNAVPIFDVRNTAAPPFLRRSRFLACALLPRR